MIDKSISDPTKEIWINLELYFENYKFSNFKKFLEVFEFTQLYFQFLNNLKE